MLPFYDIKKLRNDNFHFLKSMKEHGRDWGVNVGEVAVGLRRHCDAISAKLVLRVVSPEKQHRYQRECGAIRRAALF